jgi:hypothetical protein
MHGGNLHCELCWISRDNGVRGCIFRKEKRPSETRRALFTRGRWIQVKQPFYVFAAWQQGVSLYMCSLFVCAQRKDGFHHQLGFILSRILSLER